jgi:6-phosphogluconate dehydrogenase
MKSNIGLVGLGVMGRNLTLNMADHGFPVSGYDRKPETITHLREEARDLPVKVCDDLESFIRSLNTPRNVMLLVPAGPAVDAVIKDLLPYLETDDLVADCGNSHFHDTQIRMEALKEKGIHCLGIGISGGEEGARYGPSLMPGGDVKAYRRIQPVMEASAAHVGREPCVAYLGPGSAGHYVKMVHNGIEYGLMQLIAESYDFMKRVVGLHDEELHEVYSRWNKGELNSYLMEITADIFVYKDPQTGLLLVDEILDEAKQKGTGLWMSQDAMSLQVPTPSVDLAVAMRHLSAWKSQRTMAAQVLQRPIPERLLDRDEMIGHLRRGLYAGMLITFAQAMAQLDIASKEYAYELNLEEVARIWRGGCIIRAGMLDLIRNAYRERPDLPNLLVDPSISREIMERQEDLRVVVKCMIDAGIPAGGMSLALVYLDSYRSAWLPANLVQAQRDYFGAHTYERKDKRGVFHTRWSVPLEVENEGFESDDLRAAG